jgi:hypothetical protein
MGVQHSRMLATGSEAVISSTSSMASSSVQMQMASVVQAHYRTQLVAVKYIRTYEVNLTAAVIAEVNQVTTNNVSTKVIRVEMVSLIDP